MVAKTLDKKLKDKEFLRRNDFLEAVTKVSPLVKEYKVPLIFLGVVILVLMVGLPVLNGLRSHEVEEFNAKFYQAQQEGGEQVYQEILNEYSSWPASHLVRLNLADHYLNTKNYDKALEVVNEGINGAEENVLSTMLILKKIDILKEQGKLKEAAQIVDENMNKAIPTFRSRLKLLQADLYLHAGQNEKAKQTFQSIVDEGMDLNLEGEETLSVFDPNVVEKAKEQLLLLEMGEL